ncbi:hypothetical protein CYMTET_52869 [Cymbomonas tetramitiformis]|uniref:L domain-like protein n=1 Tax=Cymbomonas tetramitiformis TaxID=36881 RepID=A0AAE0BI70_9CHLO|nr:hypothetical protein CYMTET_52869 [Cymbomonas tetramitiformis]
MALSSEFRAGHTGAKGGAARHRASHSPACKHPCNQCRPWPRSNARNSSAARSRPQTSRVTMIVHSIFTKPPMILNSQSLTGTVPTEMGALTNLEYLGLSSNCLTGTVPTEIGALTNLEYMLLNVNSLTGIVPTEMGALTRLKTLFLNSNSLTSTVPTELRALTDVEKLHLDTNKLMGTAPAELGDLVDMCLSLHSNADMCGPIPEGLSECANSEDCGHGWCGTTIETTCPGSPSSSSSTSTVIYAGAAAGGSVLLLSVAAMYYYRRRKIRQIHGETPQPPAPVPASLAKAHKGQPVSGGVDVGSQGDGKAEEMAEHVVEISQAKAGADVGDAPQANGATALMDVRMALNHSGASQLEFTSGFVPAAELAGLALGTVMSSFAVLNSVACLAGEIYSMYRCVKANQRMCHRLTERVMSLQSSLARFAAKLHEAARMTTQLEEEDYHSLNMQLIRVLQAMERAHDLIQAWGADARDTFFGKLKRALLSSHFH